MKYFIRILLQIKFRLKKVSIVIEIFLYGSKRYKLLPLLNP